MDRLPLADRPIPSRPGCSPATRTIKRWFDVLMSSFMLVILAPLMAVIAVLVRVTSGRPVLFRQERPGLGGRVFMLLKFRTMNAETDDRGLLLSDDLRLTGFGRFLRRTSLDELPQLWNVVKGEMSLVGPRPLLTEYMDRYSPEQARRHEVRPGITGLAQVHGRNLLSWEERLKMDVWYVDNLRLRLDLGILWKTLVQVLKQDGISARNHASMPPFVGSGRSGGSS